MAGIERAVRLASLQGEQIVVIVDDCDERVEPAVRAIWIRSIRSVRRRAAGLTILQLERTESETDLAACAAWSLKIGLKPMTRFESESYLTAKAHWAGIAERLFTPRAITRIHALSLGIPQGLEQLASTCLMAGAIRGLEVVNPDLVDAAAHECWPPFAARALDDMG